MIFRGGGDNMNFKYTNFEGLSNYCLGICNNKKYVVSKENEESLRKFGEIIGLINNMIEQNKIELNNDMYINIINMFIFDPNTAFYTIEYFNKRLDKVKNREIDFYYFISSLKTMMNIDLQFTEQYLLNEIGDIDNIYYPHKLKCLVLNKNTARVYTLNQIDDNELNKYGIYFIYDENGILKYIGKSTTCVITRSFKSAKERSLINFSKIEYRYPKTKSDVALYESYYISKYKPEKNNDMIFDDNLSIDLPELDVGYFIERSTNNYIEKEYLYYSEKVLNISEYFCNKKVFLNNEKNKEYLSKKNIYSRSESYNLAFNECISKAQKSNLILLNNY